MDAVYEAQRVLAEAQQVAREAEARLLTVSTAYDRAMAAMQRRLEVVEEENRQMREALATLLRTPMPIDEDGRPCDDLESAWTKAWDMARAALRRGGSA